MRIFGSLIVAIIALTFSGCDKVDNPVVDLGPDATIDSTVVFTSYEDNSANRNALLMDFTGHNCAACPSAALLAEELIDDYPNQVHVIAVHASTGLLTDPQDDHPLGAFQTDWITPEGNELYELFQIDGIPSGVISALETPNGFFVYQSDWREMVETAIASPSILKVSLDKGYSESNRSIVVRASINVQQDIDNNLAIVVALVESNLIDWQLNGSANFPANPNYPGGLIDSYEHNHVLRKHLNGLQGADISQGPLSASTEDNPTIIEYEYSGVISEDYIAENCDVVVWVYDKETFEIYQAVEAHLID